MLKNTWPLYRIYIMIKEDKKITLVTGASSGIGRAAARLMAKNGYCVYGTSRSAVYETVDFEGASYMMIPMTMEDEQSIKQAVDYIVKRHGRIDYVVNAAGRGVAGAIEETTAQEAAAPSKSRASRHARTEKRHDNKHRLSVGLLPGAFPGYVQRL